MKTKHLLLSAVMLMLTVLTAMAQNITDMHQRPVYPKPNSSNDIPFGKKLPSPPDLNFKFKSDSHTNNQSSQSLPVSGASFNKTRLPALAKITHQQNNNAIQNTNNNNANKYFNKNNSLT